MHIELEDVLSDGGDRVLTIHRASAQRTASARAREALVVTVHDGRITELQDFFGTSPTTTRSGPDAVRGVVVAGTSPGEHPPTSRRAHWRA